MAARPRRPPRRPVPLTTFPRIHAVTDDRVLSLPDFLARAEAVAAGPDYALHLRGRVPADRLLALADRLRHITARTGAALLVHDRLDVALLCEADGLHLPTGGFPTDAVRSLLGETAWVGRSVHDPTEARVAQAAGLDYVFLGNIWETASHPGRPGLGTAAITAAQPARCVAIGGITLDTAPAAIAAGAAGIAAIRAFWDATDPGAAARAFRVLFGR